MIRYDIVLENTDGSFERLGNFILPDGKRSIAESTVCPVHGKPFKSAPYLTTLDVSAETVEVCCPAFATALRAAFS